MSDQRIVYPASPLQIQPVMPAAKQVAAKSVASLSTESSKFQTVFEQKLQDVKFSQHALNRLESRNIQLDDESMARLKQAIQKVAQKGARESLIMMDSLAFVVSVPNRTVITAMDAGSMKENVFTNIDSAVIV